MADRYWVGGTATWDATAGTKWATTSGGTGGASVPTSADDVFFTNLSTGTVTLSTSTTAKSINCTGFTGTITGSANFTVAGSILLSAGMAYSHTGQVTISGTGTLTTAGKSFSTVLVNGNGITVTLGDALDVSTRTLAVNQGTFNTGNFNVIAGQLTSASGATRQIILGSSTITLGGSGAISLNQSGTQLTFNAGTSTINLTNVSATITSIATISATGVTFYNVNFTSTSQGTRSISGGINTFNNLTITGPSGSGLSTFTFQSRQIINGTFSTSGTAANRRIIIASSLTGIRNDLQINGSTSLSDTDFRDMRITGTAAPISGTRLGNLGGNTGITFTSKTVYWTTSTGGTWTDNSWAATSGGTPNINNFPLPQDTAVFNDTNLNSGAVISFSGSVYPHLCNLDFSSRTLPLTLSGSTSYTSYGDIKLSSSLTLSSWTATITLSGRKTQIITSAGRTFSNSITLDSPGGTLELADAFAQDAGTSLTINSGTFNTKNYSASIGTLVSNVNTARTITLGSSTVTIAGSVNFSSVTSLILNVGTSNIVMSGSSPTFAGGGVTFYDVRFSNTVTSIIIQGANTFRNLTFDPITTDGIKRIEIQANQIITQTLNASSSNILRRNYIVCDLVTAYTGARRTLTVGTLSANNCDFRDIEIAGGAVNTAPTGAGNLGNNVGIIFPTAKTVYWNLAGTQNWSATAWASSSGGTPDVNNFPLAQDTAVLDDTGAAGTVTIETNWALPNVDMSARTTALTFSISSNTPLCYGDWKFGSGVTTSSTTGVLWFSKRGTQTITSNGVSFLFSILIDGNVSNTVQLADALTVGSTRVLTLQSGTFDAKTFNVTLGAFESSTSNVRTLNMGTGLWSLSGVSITVWATATTTNFNFDPGTADILLSTTSNSTRTFSGGGLSYNKLTIGGATGTSTTTISGNNSFKEFASTKTVAHTIALGSTTQRFGKWTVTGTAGNVVTITGTGVSHVISGPATSNIDYLAMGSIGFSTDSPGEFYAGANSTGTASAPVFRTAAPAARTLYWVGGTGNWGDTARWSTASGGGGGAAVPTSLDNVIFDGLSNATAYTATINVIARCNQLTVNGPGSGSVTLAGTSSIYIHNNVTFAAAGVARTYTGVMNLCGNSSYTFTTNGLVLGANLVIFGTNSTWTLGSALNIGTSSIVLTTGTISGSTFNVTAGAINILTSNTNFRGIDFGSGTWTLSSGVTAIDFGTTDINRNTLTVTPGTAQINISAAITVELNREPLPNVTFTATSVSNTQINNPATFNNLTFSGSTLTGRRNIFINRNTTITNAFTVNAGTNASTRTAIFSITYGTTVTLTCGSVQLTDTDFRDITISGAAAPATGTRIGNCRGNSGITFTAAKTVYWNLPAGGNWYAAAWATSSGGTASINNFPLPQDTVIIENTGLNAGSTITVNTTADLSNMDMSTRTNSMTLAMSFALTVYENWTNGTGTAFTGTNQIFFNGRNSTQEVRSAGKTFSMLWAINNIGGTVRIMSDTTISASNSAAITLTYGTFDLNGYNLTLSGASSGFTSTASNTRTLAIGSGTFNIAGTNGYNVSGTGMNITGTGTIRLSNSTGPNAFTVSNNISHETITVDQASPATLTITGNIKLGNITNSYGTTGATTITISALSVITMSNFTAAGTVNKLLSLNSGSSTVVGELIYSGAGSISLDYLIIERIRAFAADLTWYAGTNSTNNGTYGWIFTAPPAPSTADLYFGSTQVTTVYFGSKQITEIYLGSTRVF